MINNKYFDFLHKFNLMKLEPLFLKILCLFYCLIELWSKTTMDLGDIKGVLFNVFLFFQRWQQINAQEYQVLKYWYRLATLTFLLKVWRSMLIVYTNMWVDNFVSVCVFKFKHLIQSIPSLLFKKVLHIKKTYIIAISIDLEYAIGGHD